jgi:hypothetical protein
MLRPRGLLERGQDRWGVGGADRRLLGLPLGGVVFALRGVPRARV